MRKKLVISGQLFFSLLYAQRNRAVLFIEKIRVNDTFDFGAFKASQAEIIAFILFLTGALGFYFVTWRSKKPIPE
ncbi:MAG: hypothetical protein IPI42_00695 [Saprospiraceae bacterium]|nr:hypothetical protein [Candidatus Parvibacillus calidus]